MTAIRSASFKNSLVVRLGLILSELERMDKCQEHHCEEFQKCVAVIPDLGHRDVNNFVIEKSGELQAKLNIR